MHAMRRRKAHLYYLGYLDGCAYQEPLDLNVVSSLLQEGGVFLRSIGNQDTSHLIAKLSRKIGQQDSIIRGILLLIRDKLHDEATSLEITADDKANHLIGYLAASICPGTLSPLAASEIEGRLQEEPICSSKVFLPLKDVFDEMRRSRSYSYDVLCSEITRITGDAFADTGVIASDQTATHIADDICGAIVPISGKSFCFTGEMKSMDRKTAIEHLKECGGVFKQSMSKNVDYLVVGVRGSEQWATKAFGRKYQDAKKYGVTVIEERDFLEAIKASSPQKANINYYQ